MTSLTRFSTAAMLVVSSSVFLAACGPGAFSVQTQNEIDKANGVAKVVTTEAKLNVVATDQAIDQVPTNELSVKGRNNGEGRKFHFVAKYTFNSSNSDVLTILQLNSAQLENTCAKVSPVEIRLVGNSESKKFFMLSGEMTPNKDYTLELSADLEGCITTEMKLNPIVWLGKKSDDPNAVIATVCGGAKSGTVAFFPTYNFMTAFSIENRRAYIEDNVYCGEKFDGSTSGREIFNDGHPIGKRMGFATTPKGARQYELEFSLDGKSGRISCDREDGTKIQEEFGDCERRAMDINKFLKNAPKK